MENFTPGSALLGGAVIGLSAVLLMALLGRVAGISGIGWLVAGPAEAIRSASAPAQPLATNLKGDERPLINRFRNTCDPPPDEGSQSATNG